MSDRDLLEHILYELRVANWQRSGGRSKPPTPPGGRDPVKVNGKWVFFTNTKDDEDAA